MRRKRTPEEFIAALADLFDEVEAEEIAAMTLAEVDAELRALGYDPEALGRRFQELAAAALAQVQQREILPWPTAHTSRRAEDTSHNGGP